jgi:hypothetical protein
MFADASPRRPPLDRSAAAHAPAQASAARALRTLRAARARADSPDGAAHPASRPARTTRSVAPAWELAALRRLYGA